MTWSSFRRRADVLRAVVATAESRRDGVLPVDVDGVDTAFEDQRDLLGALQLSWHTRLMGRIESRQLSVSSPKAAVVGAWQDAFAELGGVRSVLDAARESESDEVREAMGRATTKERLALAVAAGLGSGHDARSAAAGVVVGARIEQAARDTFTTTHAGTSREPVVVAPAAGVWDRMLHRLRSRAA